MFKYQNRRQSRLRDIKESEITLQQWQ